jgi:hypothetical protein
VPLSHPFVERLIGTIRRECLDRTLFWTTADLELKLLDFQGYSNGYRTHAGLTGGTPDRPERHRWLCSRECQFVSLATTLSRSIRRLCSVMLGRRLCPDSFRTSSRVDRSNAVVCSTF